MIHRVLYGSVERFLGILLEHYAGAFPVWLSPVQATVIPITDKQNDYAQIVIGLLKENGIRVELDDAKETMQNKIRNATAQKVPYLLIIGNREIEGNSVSVRQRDGQDLGGMPTDEFLTKIKEQIASKSLNLIK
jgi:threonyl-tRNA synthetase